MVVLDLSMHTIVRCFNKLIEIYPNDGYKYIIKSQFRKESDRTYIELSKHGFIYGQDFLSENFYNLYPELNLIR